MMNGSKIPPALKRVWGRIANEILMYFRSQKKSAGDVSLSDCIETGKDGTALSLMEVICDEADLFDQVSTREMSGKLRVVMEQCLTERERKILTMRFGLNGGKAMPQREVAEACSISRSYVSRIEKRALEKLRRVLEDPKE